MKKQERGLQVLFEDNHLIAVNKPAGYLVQGDVTGDKPLSDFVKQYIKIRYNKPGDVFLGVIHRLDRPVSGVVIFARTSKALTRMNEMFRDRKVQKSYWAITLDRPEPMEGKLTHWLLKDKERNFVNASKKKSADAKKAVLSYQLASSIDNHHLIAVRPHTGRPHQIRVQLARLNTSIRGDIKYGSPKPNEDGRIHLHAHALSFQHPVKKEPVLIKAETPEDQVWHKFRDFTSNYPLFHNG